MGIPKSYGEILYPKIGSENQRVKGFSAHNTQLSFHVSSTLAICSLCQDYNREQLNFPPILFDQVECNQLIKVLKI